MSETIYVVTVKENHRFKFACNTKTGLLNGLWSFTPQFAQDWEDELEGISFPSIGHRIGIWLANIGDLEIEAVQDFTSS